MTTSRKPSPVRTGEREKNRPDSNQITREIHARAVPKTTLGRGGLGRRGRAARAGDGARPRGGGRRGVVAGGRVRPAPGRRHGRRPAPAHGRGGRPRRAAPRLPDRARRGPRRRRERRGLGRARRRRHGTPRRRGTAVEMVTRRPKAARLATRGQRPPRRTASRPVPARPEPSRSAAAPLASSRRGRTSTGLPSSLWRAGPTSSTWRGRLAAEARWALRGLHDAQGRFIAGTRDNDGGAGADARLTLTAAESGTHYVAAGSHGKDTGSYRGRSRRTKRRRRRQRSVG